MIHRADRSSRAGEISGSEVHQQHADIPIYLGAEGAKNALAAEIANGYLPLRFSSKSGDFYRSALAEGFARTGARHTADSSDVGGIARVSEHDDVEPYLAGRKQDSIDAIPLEMAEDVALVGPVDKLCDDLRQRWVSTCLQP